METSDADESPWTDVDDVDADDLDDEELEAEEPAPRAILRIAAAIVVDEEGRNLLVRKRGSTQFMQAGGKLEEGEVAIEALARELAEELGFELDPGETEYLGFFRADAAHESDTELHAEVFAITVARRHRGAGRDRRTALDRPSRRGPDRARPAHPRRAAAPVGVTSGGAALLAFVSQLTTQRRRPAEADRLPREDCYLLKPL